MPRKYNGEFLPWYRKPGYRGKMTEKQKQHLDGIRNCEPHPAVKFEQLPTEAQSYINELEMEAYDARQQSLAGRTVLLSVLGAFLVDANFLHLVDVTSLWSATIAGPLLVLPWVFYVWKWRRNANEFSPAGWPNPSDEKLREAWELDYIVRHASPHD